MGLLGVGLGVGLVVIGAAYGIGKLAAAAVESIARQPEAAGNIRGTAIILAALIEGFTFFALIVALLAGNNAVTISEKEAAAKATSAIHAKP
ncbi:MAG: ATP synthase F0 subunit C [Planctomycetota bacterium]